MHIKDRVFIVTDASSGIGLSTAVAPSARGAKVALLARSTGVLQDLARRLPASLPVPVNMTQFDRVREAVGTVHRHYGRVDGLVNNAGRSYAATVEEIDPAVFDEIFHLNVLGPIVAMQAVIPLMRAQGITAPRARRPFKERARPGNYGRTRLEYSTTRTPTVPAIRAVPTSGFRLINRRAPGRRRAPSVNAEIALATRPNVDFDRLVSAACCMTEPVWDSVSPESAKAPVLSCIARLQLSAHAVGHEKPSDESIIPSERRVAVGWSDGTNSANGYKWPHFRTTEYFSELKADAADALPRRMAATEFRRAAVPGVPPRRWHARAATCRPKPRANTPPSWPPGTAGSLRVAE